MEALFTAVPFAVSAFAKLIVHYYLRGVRRQAFQQIPGYDAFLADENRRELLLKHLSHGEQKSLVPLTYYTSIVVGMVAIAREILGRVALARPIGADLLMLLSIALCALFACMGIWLTFFLNSRHPGTLDEPLRADSSGPSAATAILFLNLVVDVALGGLGVTLLLSRTTAAPG